MKPKIVLDHHLIALVDAHRRGFDNFRAAAFELGVECVEIVHPNVGVESQAAPTEQIPRRRRSIIGLPK